jgi:hypothetical protein
LTCYAPYPVGSPERNAAIEKRTVSLEGYLTDPNAALARSHPDGAPE